MENYLKCLPIHVYLYVDKYVETILEYEQPTPIFSFLDAEKTLSMDGIKIIEKGLAGYSGTMGLL